MKEMIQDKLVNTMWVMRSKVFLCKQTRKTANRIISFTEKLQFYKVTILVTIHNVLHLYSLCH